MDTVGIICEYNPFHLGHEKQFSAIHAALGADCGIVCLMSGNFVQRGKPAIVDKSLRAEAAVRCGADLVLELPVTAVLSSAEGFASRGVAILGSFCSHLCFGAEDPTAPLLPLAQALLSPDFSAALRAQLDTGASFPAARQQALEAMGLDGSLLSKPNNILAVEYCKAILAQHSTMRPMPIFRGGSYHATTPEPENPSATALRLAMERGEPIAPFLPKSAAALLENAPLHSFSAGERAILARLRTMTEEEFSRLPFGSEGLWRKLMHAARREASVEAIATAVKSRRYTRTRIDRMILCAFLGLTAADLETPPPYARVLAFNDRGRELLNTARGHADFPNTGALQPHPYQAIESRVDDLYGLFATASPEPAGVDRRRRVRYCR